MTNRSAVSTIAGYFYQFDLSILSIIELARDDDRVSIECVEDIDVHTATESTAIQCKYYEKSDYNHSVIKPAIIFMLAHYVQSLNAGDPKIKYAVKGHFNSGQDKLALPFDLQFLKDNFLSYVSKGVACRKHEELNVSDEALSSFLATLSIDINARRFDEQFSEIVGKLAAMFGCKPFTAEFFLYNNALRVIKELSIKPEVSDRTITKRQFLTQIDTSNLLFDEWFIAKRGKAKYLTELRAEFFSSLNISSAERLFIIHIDPIIYSRRKVRTLIEQISRKYSKI